MFRCTKWLSGSSRATLVLVSILLGSTGITLAQGFGAGPLVPSKVYMNTETGPLYLDGGDPYTAAFAPTDVTCPASRVNGCTLRVVTSFQTTDVPAGGHLYAHVYAVDKIVGKKPPYAYPNSVILIDAGATTSTWSNHTFQWMIKTVAAGSTVTVHVELQNLTGTAETEERIETIELLFN
jgi:hypothetical protein